MTFIIKPSEDFVERIKSQLCFVKTLVVGISWIA